MIRPSLLLAGACATCALLALSSVVVAAETVDCSKLEAEAISAYVKAKAHADANKPLAAKLTASALFWPVASRSNNQCAVVNALAEALTQSGLGPSTRTTKSSPEFEPCRPHEPGCILVKKTHAEGKGATPKE